MSIFKIKDIIIHYIWGYFCYTFAGKTVISKQKAIQTAEEDETKDVYFISLVGSTDTGKPMDTRCILDICTKEYDFKSTKVKAIDVPSLLDFLRKQRSHVDIDDIIENTLSSLFEDKSPTRFGKLSLLRTLKKKLKIKEKPKQTEDHHNGDETNINVYKLVEFFIEKNPHGHFIIDECPIIRKGKCLVFFSIDS